jgi:hypothetical protein
MLVIHASTTEFCCLSIYCVQHLLDSWLIGINFAKHTIPLVTVFVYCRNIMTRASVRTSTARPNTAPALGAHTMNHGGAPNSNRQLRQAAVHQPLVPLQYVLSQIYFCNIQMKHL